MSPNVLLYTAHHYCAGHTAKAAKRAKFHCPRCRAKTLLAKPQKHRTHSPSPSTSTFISNKEDTATTMNTASNSRPPRNSGKSSCLCDSENFCDNCLSLQVVAHQSLADSRKVNQTLQLHSLNLEERIKTLEEKVKSPGRLERIEKEIVYRTV